jgi:DNA-binding winged helix-turn-helix (wHTH) protein
MMLAWLVTSGACQMEASDPAKGVYRFGVFELDPDSATLLRQGVTVKLQEQPLRVLCRLLQRPGELVSREELCQSAWPNGTYVEFDTNLNAIIKRLRSALGGSGDRRVRLSAETSSESDRQ